MVLECGIVWYIYVWGGSDQIRLCFIGLRGQSSSCIGQLYRPNVQLNITYVCAYTVIYVASFRSLDRVLRTCLIKEVVIVKLCFLKCWPAAWKYIPRILHRFSSTVLILTTYYYCFFISVCVGLLYVPRCELLRRRKKSRRDEDRQTDTESGDGDSGKQKYRHSNSNFSISLKQCRVTIH